MLNFPLLPLKTLICFLAGEHDELTQSVTRVCKLMNCRKRSEESLPLNFVTILLCALGLSSPLMITRRVQHLLSEGGEQQPCSDAPYPRC